MSDDAFPSRTVASKVLIVYPLLFGRARLGVAQHAMGGFDDVW